MEHNVSTGFAKRSIICKVQGTGGKRGSCGSVPHTSAEGEPSVAGVLFGKSFSGGDLSWICTFLVFRDYAWIHNLRFSPFVPPVHLGTFNDRGSFRRHSSEGPRATPGR